MSRCGFATSDGETICDECVEGDTDSEEFYPLDWSEQDSPPHCSYCGHPLNHGGYTQEGVKYILDAIRCQLKRPRAERIAKTRTGPPWYEGSASCAVVLDWAHEVQPYVRGRERRMVHLFIQWSQEK